MGHASPSNIWPWGRAICSVILNPVRNALARHDYKHHRDRTPVTPLPDDCLRSEAAAERGVGAVAN